MPTVTKQLIAKAQRLARQHDETIWVVCDPACEPPDLFLLRASRHPDEPWIEDGDIVAVIEPY